MSACDWLEREGLLRHERGLPLDHHLEACDRCRAEWDAFCRLQQAISDLGKRYRPPEGWKARVLEAAGKGEARRRIGSRWLLVAAPAAAAFAAFVFLFFSSAPTTERLQLQVLSEQDRSVRSSMHHPGDRLTIRAMTGGASQAELRIYQNDTQLVLRCTTEPPCESQGDTLRAEWTLPSVGAFQVLLVLSDRQIPQESASLESDTQRILASGARVYLEEIEVW